MPANSSAAASASPGSPLDVITRRRTEGVFILLEPVPGGYACRVRENLIVGEWATLEPGHLGHATPEEALLAVDAAITAWQGARESAVDAEVVIHLGRGHLRMQKFRNEEGQEEDRWAARRADGTWSEGHAEPRAAVRAALARARP